jgi:phenylacetate-coenzyme A ligase PaaK-like adenylate-forming protein
MPDAMLHPEFETLAPAPLRRHQDELWRDQWARVRVTSVFYKQKFGPSALSTISLDALADLPFTDKDELRSSQEAGPRQRTRQRPNGRRERRELVAKCGSCVILLA